MVTLELYPTIRYRLTVESKDISLRFRRYGLPPESQDGLTGRTNEHDTDLKSLMEHEHPWENVSAFSPQAVTVLA